MVDIDKFIISMINSQKRSGYKPDFHWLGMAMIEALKDQDLEYKEGAIVTTSPNLAESEDERIKTWSEEDEERYISCLQRLGTGNPEQPETINSKWFKEHVYPKTTWRPSDEQMKALYDSIPENVMEISERKMLLNELYKDLRKEYYGR